MNVCVCPPRRIDTSAKAASPAVRLDGSWAAPSARPPLLPRTLGGGGSGRGSIVGQLGAAPGAPDATPLAELVEHVAQQDAVAGLGSGPTDGLPVSHHAMLAGALPAGLLEWVVDPEAVSYLRWPNGKLKELGRGAR